MTDKQTDRFSEVENRIYDLRSKMLNDLGEIKYPELIDMIIDTEIRPLVDEIIRLEKELKSFWLNGTRWMRGETVERECNNKVLTSLGYLNADKK